ncbi:MAG: polyphosphate kinase 2 family protein [Phycisphaeraceae bacterium]|nr:polyphosphate kinase 2 family protein [Phycisphaeraceae bacterium]
MEDLDPRFVRADSKWLARHRVEPGGAVDLASIPSVGGRKLDKKSARKAYRRSVRKLSELQEKFYADGRFAMLVVFQAMDAGGKDSTIRNVLGPLNPQGCRVSSFKVPHSEEAAHDYLWRIHRAAPARGMIGVFNRSHYEDVLVVRVKNLVEEERWRRRYEHINQFEKMLSDEGTVIVKFFLHISNEYQRKRLQRRLDRPDKHWKFSPADLAERARWPKYTEAFEEALARCSTPHAPWHIIPAENRWYRNLAVARILLATMRKLDLSYPEVTFDPSEIKLT